MRRAILAALAGLSLAGGLTACGTAADTVSKNISKDAEQFRVVRRIIVVNGITDKVEWEVDGRCSYENPPGELDLTCKEGPDAYKKHVVGLSDNVFFVVAQIRSVDESEYHTKIIFRPESIVPGVDVVTGEQP